jgi:hypothetical protein
MRFFSKDRFNRKLYMSRYNMHNILEKHFSISIAFVRSMGGSLVVYIVYTLYCMQNVTPLCIPGGVYSGIDNNNFHYETNSQFMNENQFHKLKQL